MKKIIIILLVLGYMVLSSCKGIPKSIEIGECEQNLIVIKKITIENATKISLAEGGASFVTSEKLLKEFNDFSSTFLINKPNTYIVGNKALVMFASTQNLLEEYSIDCKRLELYENSIEKYKEYSIRKYNTNDFLLCYSSVICLNKYLPLTKKGKLFIDTKYGESAFFPVVIPLCT